MKGQTTLLLAWTALASSCGILANPMGVQKLGYTQVYEELTDNVLSSGRLSMSTREALHLFDLDDEWQENRIETLEKLHEYVYEVNSAGLLYALSEMSYAIANQEDDRAYYLLSAIYAYYCLLGTDTEAPNPFDRRFRVACDLYNRGLAQALQPGSDLPMPIWETIELELPIGSAAVIIQRQDFPWEEGTFDLVLPADQYTVKGLSFRVRSPGLGVPLIALRSDEESSLSQYVPSNLKLPCTAFLRLAGDIQDLESGLVAHLEVYPAYSNVSVGDHTIPLETDVTAPLAYMLGERNVIRLGIAGFLGKEEELPLGISMIEPYQKGKIPIVFVHGTASGPSTWADLFNGLNADSYVREKFQFWFFSYASGNPVSYSAWKLRSALAQVIADLDPEGVDESLQDMVLVGHSQGGMLVRMMVTDGSERFVEALPFSLDEVELDEESRTLIEDCVVFDPAPSVTRVVFMSTPHRGSFVAGGWVGRFFKKRVQQALDLRNTMTNLFSSDRLPEELTKGAPTSVDNMTAKNAFVQTLAAAPIEGVPYHSIIAVKTEGPVEEGNDGVVAYESAHLEGANSELVVESGHSVQKKARAVLELRRILYEHLGELPHFRIRSNFADVSRPLQ